MAELHYFSNNFTNIAKLGVSPPPACQIGFF